MTCLEIIEGMKADFFAQTGKEAKHIYLGKNEMETLLLEIMLQCRPFDKPDSKVRKLTGLILHETDDITHLALGLGIVEVKDRHPLIALAEEMANNARTNDFPEHVEALQSFIDRAMEMFLSLHSPEYEAIDSDHLVIRKDYIKHLIAGVRKQIACDTDNITANDLLGEEVVISRWCDASILCDVVEQEILNNDAV